MVLPQVFELTSLWFLVTKVVPGMGSASWIKANQTLIGYSHKICATIALGYFAGRTDCRSKGSLVGVHISLSVVSRELSHTKETKM